MNTPARGAWKASLDTPLKDILQQMGGLNVNLVEIAMGQTTVSIVLGPTAKQPGLREVIERYKAVK